MTRYTGIDCKGNRWEFPNLSAAMHQAWELARFYALPTGEHVFMWERRADWLTIRVRQDAHPHGDSAVLMDLYC